MSFDSVAAIYRTLEAIVFGTTLQQARVAFIDELHQPRRALIVGEGNCRFLEAFGSRFPAADVDCIDASAAMLRLAQKRAASKNVRFIHADILEHELPHAAYDCVATHFLLDCFDVTQLTNVIARIGDAAAPEAVWLIAEFAMPSSRVMRCIARPLIALMYAFFRATAGISGNHLIDYDPLLADCGFRCVARRTFLRGIVKSEVWRRD